MDEAKLKQIVEGTLMAAGRPLNLDQILAVFEENEQPDKQTLRRVLHAVAEDYEDRAIELKEVASGFRFQVRPDFSTWVSRLWEERPGRYSRALLETLALIAYRQPITRAEIEDVRGVSVSTSIMRTLQERGWVKVVGHRDVPGRPGMYATTREFLDYFGLKSMDELPPLSELRDIDSINVELDLGEDASQTGTQNEESDDAEDRSGEAAGAERSEADDEAGDETAAADGGEAGDEEDDELDGDDTGEEAWEEAQESPVEEAAGEDASEDAEVVASAAAAIEAADAVNRTVENGEASETGAGEDEGETPPERPDDVPEPGPEEVPPGEPGEIPPGQPEEAPPGEPEEVPPPSETARPDESDEAGGEADSGDEGDDEHAGDDTDGPTERY